MTRNNPNKAKP